MSVLRWSSKYHCILFHKSVLKKDKQHYETLYLFVSVNVLNVKTIFWFGPKESMCFSKMQGMWRGNKDGVNLVASGGTKSLKTLFCFWQFLLLPKPIKHTFSF